MSSSVIMCSAIWSSIGREAVLLGPSALDADIVLSERRPRHYRHTHKVTEATDHPTHGLATAGEDK